MKLHLLAAAATAVASQAASAVVIDLGVLPSPTRVPSTVTGTLAPNDLLYVTFTLPAGAQASAGSFLDITTNGTTFDSEIALYSGTIFNAAGTVFIAEDDDDGIGLASTLSFGAGSGLLLGDPFNLGGNGLAEGEDGDLAPGQYIFVLGEFVTTFGPTVDTAVSTGPDTGGEYIVNFFVGIPEPTTAAFAGLGSLALLRRRRA